MAPGAKKKDKMTVLDEVIIDLYKRVEPQLDYASLSAEEHLESIAAIQRILHQVQKHEKERVAHVLAQTPPLASAEARMQELTSWLEANGVKLEGLELRSGLPEGCGVVATRDFSEGELLAKVPSELAMTVLTGIQSKDDVALLFLADTWFSAVPSLVLTMHLLFEKHRASPDSKWKGYIRSLPGQLCLGEHNKEGPDSVIFPLAFRAVRYGTALGEHNQDEPDSAIVPLAFSMEAITQLKGSTALVEYHKMFRTVVKQYCRMRTTLYQLGRKAPELARAANEWFSFAEFRWAVSTVMMRQNPVPAVAPSADGKTQVLEATLALVPLLDMFNHEEGPITSHYDGPTEAVEMTAKRDFKAGDQVYMSYGARPSAMMLFYNGFLPETNTRDRARVPFALATSDPLYAKKVALLKWLELPPAAELDVFCSGAPSPALAKWLEVTTLESEEAVTALMRSVIGARAQETARALEQQKLSLSEGNAPAQGVGSAGVPGVLQGEAEGSGGGEGEGQGKVGGEAGKGENGEGGAGAEGGVTAAAAAEMLRRGVEVMKEACEARLRVLKSEAGPSVTVTKPAAASAVTVRCDATAGNGGFTAAGEEGLPMGGPSNGAPKANGTHKESSDAPTGLGFGLKKRPSNSKATASASNSNSNGNSWSAACVERESQMTREVWNLEVRALEKALERCRGLLVQEAQ